MSNTHNADIILVRLNLPTAILVLVHPTDELSQAGGVAAFTVDLLIYPLDTLKTRYQSADYASVYARPGSSRPSPALFRGLYQGVGSVILVTLPAGLFYVVL